MNNKATAILVVYYSHSGETRSAITELVKYLRQRGHDVCVSAVRTEEEIPFPWNRARFFGVFSDTILGQPQKVFLDPMPDEEKDWSLVILAFPPWYLSPARPFQSLMQARWLDALSPGTPVVALLTCRNMWVAAMNDVKAWFGNQLKAFVVFADPHPNLISLLTTLRFLLKGKKRLFGSWGPEAGFGLDRNRKKIERIAETLNETLHTGKWDELHQQWVNEQLVTVNPALLLMELRGRRNFIRFARFIESADTEAKRQRRIQMLSWLLPFAVVLLSPLTFLLTQSLRILNKKKLERLCIRAVSLECLPPEILASPHRKN